MSEPVDCSQWGDLESGEEELAEEEEQQPALTDGMQTPSGLETPSGMGSVVSSVAAGLEAPDFFKLCKNAAQALSEVDSKPSSLYQVVPERQISVCRLIGSKCGYDVSVVTGAGAVILVLGNKCHWHTKVCSLACLPVCSVWLTCL